jgi:hypothetical protein
MPTEQEIDILIAGCGRKTATYLQLLKDTGARCGEISFEMDIGGFSAEGSANQCRERKRLENTADFVQGYRDVEQPAKEWRRDLCQC